jgi:hypothetical protein
METVQTPLPGQPAQANNKLAIAAGSCGLGSVVLSLIGLLSNLLIPGVGLAVCCGIGLLAALVGLVLGIIALVQIKNNPGQKGKVWAIIGVVLGGIAVVLLCLSPVLVTSSLLLLGPTIGNVFSKINSSLVTPQY